MAKKKIFRVPSDKEFQKIRALVPDPDAVSPEDFNILYQNMADNEITSYQSALGDTILNNFVEDLVTGRGGKNVQLHFNHNTDGQLAFGRSFDGKIVTIPGRKTSYGAPYKVLRGAFYVPVEGDHPVPGPKGWLDSGVVTKMKIADLENRYRLGLLSSGSVGFSPNSAVCSACGSDWVVRNEEGQMERGCDHNQGTVVKNKPVFVLIGEQDSKGKKGGRLREYSFVGSGAVAEAGPVNEYNYNDNSQSMNLAFDLKEYDMDPEEATGSTVEPSVPTNLEEGPTTPPAQGPAQWKQLAEAETRCVELEAKNVAFSERIKALTVKITDLESQLEQQSEAKTKFAGIQDTLSELVEMAKEFHVKARGQVSDESVLDQYAAQSPKELSASIQALVSEFVTQFSTSQRPVQTTPVKVSYNHKELKAAERMLERKGGHQ